MWKYWSARVYILLKYCVSIPSVWMCILALGVSWSEYCVSIPPCMDVYVSQLVPPLALVDMQYVLFCYPRYTWKHVLVLWHNVVICSLY